MERTKVNSSSIASIGYDPESKQLYVEYKNGGVYAYQGVTPEHYQTLLNAKSLGSHVVKHIKPHFKHTKI